jgi:hypothetical protein
MTASLATVDQAIDWLNAYLGRPSPSRVVRAIAARRG